MNCRLDVRRIVVACALLAVVLARAGCRMHRDPEQELMWRCENISNDGILWAEVNMGVYPLVEGQNEKWVLNTGLDAYPHLLEALDDPDRWVAAHVLLTKKRLMEIGPVRWPLSYTEWSGLHIEYLSGGTVHFDHEQRTAIRQHWINQLSA